MEKPDESASVSPEANNGLRSQVRNIFVTKREQFLMLAILVCIGAAVLGWYGWQSYQKSENRDGEYGSLGATGTMLLTLKTKGANYIPGIYTYTIKKGEGPHLLLNNERVNVGGAFSSSGALVYYRRSVLQTGSQAFLSLICAQKMNRRRCRK